MAGGSEDEDDDNDCTSDGYDVDNKDVGRKKRCCDDVDNGEYEDYDGNGNDNDVDGILETLLMCLLGWHDSNYDDWDNVKEDASKKAVMETKMMKQWRRRFEDPNKNISSEVY